MSDRGDEAIIRVDKDIIKFFVASSNSLDIRELQKIRIDQRKRNSSFTLLCILLDSQNMKIDSYIVLKIKTGD